MTDTDPELEPKLSSPARSWALRDLGWELCLGLGSVACGAYILVTGRTYHYLGLVRSTLMRVLTSQRIDFDSHQLVGGQAVFIDGAAFIVAGLIICYLALFPWTGRRGPDDLS